MPRESPHPLALFSLCPVKNSDGAKCVVSHLRNTHRVSRLSSGELALDVGLHIQKMSSQTLATLGLGDDADIYVEGPGIAKVQCSFEIDLGAGCIMFYDRSQNCTTQVFGENATPFEHGSVRKVFVRHGLNSIIGMGGEQHNLVRFQLKWHHDSKQTSEAIKFYKAPLFGRALDLDLAQTDDEVQTELLSRQETRPYALEPLQRKIRYLKLDQLGSGSFGTVYKAIDEDSGKAMAVKILERPASASEQHRWRKSVYYAFRREVENLSKIRHQHIVEYIASQGWDGPKVEIFMGLKEGTLESLIENGAKRGEVANSVLPQMLRALDHISWMGIIHRDVKPDNILYILHPGCIYQFQLGDFGICNRASNAMTFIGTKPYMAPEIDWGVRGVQTSKIDVWSLFVTMMWTLDVGEFRQWDHQPKSPEDSREAVSNAASKGELSSFKEMAIREPEKRASAAQMLVKCYNGVGLSTPLHQIPALISYPSPAIAAANVRAPARLALATGINYLTNARQGRDPGKVQFPRAAISQKPAPESPWFLGQSSRGPTGPGP